MPGKEGEYWGGGENIGEGARILGREREYREGERIP